ncbi:MAG: TrmH family RNA methyltransferase, partial [Epsilonproteobacteria bacterium]|nr:TrmH family RNA methyltransferase [Campylobacterota bacterium]
DVLNELKQVGFTLYGASMDGESINNIEFMSKKVLIVGSEGEGLSKRVLSKIDKLVSIPMKHDFDSLNVSVAAAILFYRMNCENR